MRLSILILSCVLLVMPRAVAAPRLPNIVVILADDVGYGDLGCYGATKVKTPNLDRLAAEGLRFTDAHCTSGTCTPSRYSLMTGEYAWRKKGTGILPGDASLIIDPGSPTLQALLTGKGYSTAAVGKWHLGLGRGKVDWNGDIEPGPLEVGFRVFVHHPRHRRPGAVRVRAGAPGGGFRPVRPDRRQLRVESR